MNKRCFVSFSFPIDYFHVESRVRFMPLYSPNLYLKKKITKRYLFCLDLAAIFSRYTTAVMLSLFDISDIHICLDALN